MSKRIQSTIKSLAIMATLVVIWGSLKKPEGEPSPLPHLDKLIHFGAYAFQGVLYSLGFTTSPSKIIGFLIFLGLGVEFAQWPLPYRYFSVLDFLANGLGALYGVLFFRGLLDFRNTSGSN